MTPSPPMLGWVSLGLLIGYGLSLELSTLLRCCRRGGFMVLGLSRYGALLLLYLQPEGHHLITILLSQPAGEPCFSLLELCSHVIFISSGGIRYKSWMSGFVVWSLPSVCAWCPGSLHWGR